MDKFTTLEPVRLYASPPAAKSSRKNLKGPHTPFIGRLPTDLHTLILSYIPIPDFVAYSRCSHSAAALAQDDTIWQARWNALEIEKYNFNSVLDELDSRSQQQLHNLRTAAPPTLAVDDEFGDFASVDVVTAPPDEMGDFVGAFNNMAIPIAPSPLHKRISILSKFIRVHKLLKPLTHCLSSPPNVILSDLAAYVSSPRHEAMLLHLLSLYLAPRVQPVRQWLSMYSSLRSAMDRFDANLLAAFDLSDSKGDEKGMKDAAESSWEVRDGASDWEMGKVWAEKLEIFYEQGKWNPLDNFTKEGQLDFEAMDGFMSAILNAILQHGSRAVRVFPPASQVLLAFADRVASELVGEYIASLLARAREISNATYLRATAAAFREAFRMVDAILQASTERDDSNVSNTKAEDVVYRMFEINMDEYLDEEVDSAKVTFESICKKWEIQSSRQRSVDSSSNARFLGSHNPAQVKRNVLASFTNALLLPVTIVPRAVGGVLMTGGNAAVQGIAMLNPQRWGGNSSNSPANGYSNTATNDTLFEEEADDEKIDTNSSSTNNSSDSSATSELTGLDLLLSLDVALELIHADREALKRVEAFSGYPGHYGHRVRDTIEELFILMLQFLSDHHTAPGFASAIEQMTRYKPAEHEATMNVAPLLQFFELVHLGDTIQSMVQVYFDKELAPHIDKTDFLNAVVREKKRFENNLDDCVASGLNAGTEVLMNQVEHIIQTLTKPREYYPPEDKPLDLGPTRGCTEAIKCLEKHIKLLKGSTSKEVLEVFHQEVGIRLIAILQKHIKRQIVSLNGGFQVIADLNCYHAFITSLKVPSIASEFSHLKMLGHVYVVEDAKDLAQIVRDVARYGGAYRPEDIYEFLQRRSDWKRIEKTVDKTMYNLSFKEDCAIC